MDITCSGFIFHHLLNVSDVFDNGRDALSTVTVKTGHRVSLRAWAGCDVFFFELNSGLANVLSTNKRVVTSHPLHGLEFGLMGVVVLGSDEHDFVVSLLDHEFPEELDFFGGALEISDILYSLLLEFGKTVVGLLELSNVNLDRVDVLSSPLQLFLQVVNQCFLSLSATDTLESDLNLLNDIVKTFRVAVDLNL